MGKGTPQTGTDECDWRPIASSLMRRRHLYSLFEQRGRAGARPTDWLAIRVLTGTSPTSGWSARRPVLYCDRPVCGGEQVL